MSAAMADELSDLAVSRGWTVPQLARYLLWRGIRVENAIQAKRRRKESSVHNSVRILPGSTATAPFEEMS
jgi:hypothetical protein